MNTKLILEVNHLKKYFPIRKTLFSRNVRWKKSVDDVSFSIHQGKIFGLIGESGCGKTTVGKTILKLHEPTDGVARFKDKTIFDVKNKIVLDPYQLTKMRREMQIVLQDPVMSLDPRKNIITSLAIGVKKHKVVADREIETYCAEILEKCGIDPSMMWRYPHQFSGGQRQRIGIARALALKPEFIVCDEPTSALDVSIQSSILNLLLELKEQMNLTYLFISHNIDVVKNFCDEIAVMYKGKIVEKLPAVNFDSQLLHPYTISLIESVSVKYPWERKKKRSNTTSVTDVHDSKNGCSYSDLCPQATSKCREELPELIYRTPEHQIACHLYSN